MGEGDRMRDETRPVTILLVEDNADHAELTMRALQSGQVTCSVQWVKDGKEALDYVFRQGPYADASRAPRPGLILLDIKLPKVDGLRLLRQIKDAPELRAIPVVMLTTSERGDELAQCYQAGANSYVIKPVQFGEFLDRVRSIRHYWFETNRLADA